ncbi:MAG: ATPase involved in chromosome partitioning [Clostridiales bacterium]|jgi:predicted Fe-Mo cluster-binding NifX family protein|nr:ATPase involved in chromosome partitioning [Clostridiales bacterium]
MIIAIATEGTNVSQHFGKCENFTILELENSAIKSKALINTDGNQHGLLPAFLASKNVNVVIVGGMGDGARQNLIKNKIDILSGAAGDIEEVIKGYLDGSLKFNNTGCSSHEHSHEHNHEEGGCSCGHN